MLTIEIKYYIQGMYQEKQHGSCSASRVNRSRFLSNLPMRNSTLDQIKILLKQVNNLKLSNQLSSLIYEVYLDAQYRERTNLQMHDRIIQLQSQLEHFSSPQIQTSYSPQASSIAQKYQRIIRNHQNQVTTLCETLHQIQMENQQLKNQLANSHIDQETQLLIESITVQLQSQKNNSRRLTLKCFQLESQISDLEHLLSDKKKPRRFYIGESKGVADVNDKNVKAN